jgi:sortase A
VRIETADGLQHRYRVTGTTVMHKSSLGVVLDGESEDSRLTLVTCYPFRAVDPRGPLRYVVSGVKLDARLPADL